MKQKPEKILRLKNTKHKAFFLTFILGLTLISVVGLRNLSLDNTLLAEAAPTRNSLPSDLSLPPIHPDEPAEYTFSERLSRTNALDSASKIGNALSSFRKLTAKAQTVLEPENLNEVGNTDWEIQNLGFPNWVNTVEGTIEKQNYQLKKLEWELAQKQYEAGEINRSVLDSKAESYETAKQNFQQFWQSLKITD